MYLQDGNDEHLRTAFAFQPLCRPSVQLLAMTTRAALHHLENLTYNVTEKEKDILTEANGKLREIYSEYYRRCPTRHSIATTGPTTGYQHALQFCANFD